MDTGNEEEKYLLQTLKNGPVDLERLCDCFCETNQGLASNLILCAFRLMQAGKIVVNLSPNTVGGKVVLSLPAQSI